jgi:hypothetical protein
MVLGVFKVIPLGYFYEIDIQVFIIFVDHFVDLLKRTHKLFTCIYPGKLVLTKIIFKMQLTLKCGGNFSLQFSNHYYPQLQMNSPQ